MTKQTKDLKPHQNPRHKPVPTTHLYVLLDRSGSMDAIRDDVIGGFNAFVAAQQADGDDARLTLVQFDSQDPAELVLDDRPIMDVAPLTAEVFVPRGGTPLLDATGLLLARAEGRVRERRAAKRPAEEIVVVTITDGQENQSREFSRSDIKRRVRELEAEGWTFVFLSAGIDAYDEAGGIGYDPRAVQSWAPDAGGAAAAFGSLSEATAGRRQKVRAAAPFVAADFFEGHKPAEEDRSSRRGN